MTATSTPFIDVVVGNRSTVDATTPFSVTLFFDGREVHTFQLVQGAHAGGVIRIEDWDGLGEQVDVAPGPHTLRIVIDPENAVQEAREDDNVYERTVVWAAGDIADPQPISYTSDDLREMLSGLPALLDLRESVVDPDGGGHEEEVLRIADAAYFLTTGRSLRDERVNIFLLDRDDYLDWIDSSFADEFAVREESEYEAILARRERTISRVSGFKTRALGRVAIVLDADRNGAEVINTLAHELGHMLQDLVNPEQTEAPSSFSLQGIQEAEAQQFQRAFWLKLEEFTGLSLLSYPDYRGFHLAVDQRFNELLLNANRDEHMLGYLIQWLAVFDDPALVNLEQQIAMGGSLDAAGALELFDYLVGLPAESAQAYVRTRLGSLRDTVSDVAGIAKRRLVPDPGPEVEGAPDLRLVGLLMP